MEARHCRPGRESAGLQLCRYRSDASRRTGDDAALHFLWNWQRTLLECDLERLPLPRLLAQVTPKRNVTTVLFRAADGYYETFRFEKAMEPTTLVAYEMNGEPLPQGHGFPLRLIVPGLYGEKNPRSLTRIELLDEADGRLHRRHGCGFYKEQGWGRQGDAIPTHSRFDAPQVRGDHFEAPFQVGKPVELRGMAIGGDRGILKVEISSDDGETWDDAEITKPGTKLSWSLWSYQWTPDEEGETKLVVRATDGDS